ncbi:MAG: hypothetical protein LM523_11515 [Candidatus Contendobacter sp.]|nr:hypothetical protein [Candidatus Contendobacter sp.]
MIGKFIGIEGTSTMVTLWIEDLETHEVNQISSDLAVFFEQISKVFPGGDFREKTVDYEVSEEGMLTKFIAVEN